MKRIACLSLLAMTLALPAAHAADNPTSISGTVRAELAQARGEIRREMAKARTELEQGNLSLGTTFNVGKRGELTRASGSVPAAHITPAGELVIEGATVATTPEQRQLLLNYRNQVIGLAKSGVDAGEKAAIAAMAATDVSLFRLLTSAMSGSLAKRIETTVKQNLAPMLAHICQQLPQMLVAQDAAAQGVEAFRPYAKLQKQEVENCNSEVASQLAMR